MIRHKNNQIIVIFSIATFIFIIYALGWAETKPIQKTGQPDLEAILQGVEQRYSGTGFSADFTQASTLKVMQITDTAYGKALFKRPGKMRWEYESPEMQTIITDGQKLWVYRPEDNQVMIGNFPSFFGEGKGAGFLSDMGQIRKKFKIDLEKKDNANYYFLTLRPKAESQEIRDVKILVRRDTFIVETIITYNIYGDETRIKFNNIEFKEKIEDRHFTFSIPEGADIVQID